MKNKKEAFKNQKGTTLVEIMLSVALLAIIVTPLLGAVYSSIKNNTTAKDKTEAIALAERVMGEIKARAVIGVGSDVMPATANGLEASYEIVLDDKDKGKVAQSTDSAYSYATADANEADFELEIDQGDLNDHKVNVTFKDNNPATDDIELTVDVIDKDLKFILEKYDDAGSSLYRYSFFEDTDNGFIAFSPRNNANNIKLKITYKGAATPSSTEQLKIFTDITSSNSSDDNFFKVYVINNEEANSGVNFINKGTTNFEVNYMDSNAFNYTGALNQLFKVIVTIKKNSTEIYKTTSYVKK